MTLEEKAKDLFNKMLPFQEHGMGDGRDGAKKCALICVDEILELLKSDWGDNQWRAMEYMWEWQEVKEEIGKL